MCKFSWPAEDVDCCVASHVCVKICNKMQRKIKVKPSLWLPGQAFAERERNENRSTCSVSIKVYVNKLHLLFLYYVS